MKADYPLGFIASVVNELRKGSERGDVSFIIPLTLFEITKTFISIEIPNSKLFFLKISQIHKQELSRS